MKKKLYKILTGLILALEMGITAVPVQVSAEEMPVIIPVPEEKNIQVPIGKNYKSAKFIAIFDYYDDYIVKAVSPSGTETPFTYDKETGIVSATVNDVETGQWTVNIKQQPVEPVIVDAENPEDISIPEPLPISPVKIQVEGSTEQLVDVTKDIAVSTDIAGLEMYFKDDSFVAEWTDTTCGNVDIKVVNAKNLQKLDTQTIKENHYELPLSSEIEEIMVTIVPSVSSNISGAESTYTFRFDNHPDAVVEYEDLTLTNHDVIKASCTINDRYGVLILVNDKKETETDILEKGTYEYEIPIDVGYNKIMFYIVDEKGNMRSFPFETNKDVVAPKLELVSTYEDIETEDEYITIEGRVEEYDCLMINSIQIEVEGDNTFKYDYKLKEGLNQISIVASDNAGNETIYDIAVTRIIPEEKPVPWLKIIIIASLVGIVIIYAVEVIRKKRNPEKYESRKKQSGKKQVSSKYDNVDISKMSSQERRTMVKGTKKNTDIIWDILAFIVPLVAAYIIVTYLILVTVVQSGSMEPTLMTGNTVFYNKLAYTNHEPERGDIVTFISTESGKYMAKRIIGLPGDSIEFKDGYVVVNGQYCDETSYISDKIETNCSKTFTVPDNCYFMLGDNRENSNDSRYWDNPYIPRECILGKYMGQIDFSFQYDILGKGNK